MPSLRALTGTQGFYLKPYSHITQSNQSKRGIGGCRVALQASLKRSHTLTTASLNFLLSISPARGHQNLSLVVALKPPRVTNPTNILLIVHLTVHTSIGTAGHKGKRFNA